MSTATTTIIRAELLKLEQSAVTLEKIVYKELAQLEWLIEDESIDKQERIILRKLRKLDDIQTEIDALVATLKERGEYTPVRIAVPYKRQEQRSKSTTKPASKRREKAAENAKAKALKDAERGVVGYGTHADRLERSKYWIAVAEKLEADGSISLNEMVELLGISYEATKGRVKVWKRNNFIVSVGVHKSTRYHAA